MQSAQRPPQFVTSREAQTDPDTGTVYEPETMIPYDIAVRLGIVPAVEGETTERSEATQSKSTSRKPAANRQAPKGDNR